MGSCSSKEVLTHTVGRKKLRTVQNPHIEREELLKLVETFENKLQRIDQEPDFKKEFRNMFPTIEEDIQLHKARLTEKRPIVVIGETSSGKSSFLNLMLNLPLLPVSHEHATAGIIKIQKSDRLAVVPRGSNKITTSEPEILQDEKRAATFVREVLEKMVTSKQSGTDEKEKTAHTEIEVFWPFDNILLEDDVTIVDTPGYGETEAMKELLMSYINKAVGFLYIVNAGNAGGIQSDRIKKIINDQHEFCEKHKTELLDQKRALVIFNKWDQIMAGNEYDDSTSRSQSDTQERVWDNNMKKLRTVWHDFDPEQAVKFSVMKARNKVTECIGVKKDQEKSTRGKILNIIEESLTNGLEPTKRWLSQVNSFLKSTIGKHLKTAHATKEEKKTLMNDFNSKKRAANKQLDGCQRQIRNKLEQEKNAMASSIHRHISSPSVRSEIEIYWTYDNFPGSLVHDDEETIKHNTTRAVLERLSQIIQRDLTNEIQGRVGKLQKEIEDDIKTCVIQMKQLDDILDKAPVKLEIHVTDIKFLSGRNSFFDYNSFAFGMFASDLFVVNWLFVAFVTESFLVGFLLFLPFLFLVSSLLGGLFSSIPHVEIMRKVTAEILQNLDIPQIQKVISPKLDKILEKVDLFFDTTVKSTLKSLESQFENICSSDEDPQVVIERYQTLNRDLQKYFTECDSIY